MLNRIRRNKSAKTIESDLFTAFVAAGAISKANSDDPKKSSLVRCARTDKGVHAAGNVISLKLIVDDPDIVKKINENLPAQIRVWGIQRTNGSFSCYQLCDSRIYEYLIPSHALLPPHPWSHLGRRLQEVAEEFNDMDGFKQRQHDVLRFWDDVDETHIKPLLEGLELSVQGKIMAAAHKKCALSTTDVVVDGSPHADANVDEVEDEESSGTAKAVRRIKTAYLETRRRFRVSSHRLGRLREVLASYCGTYNFHNYTVDKSYRDPSAKRHIMSFKAGDPILIGDTEWISLKIHGQSFMMHQIRKMVSMAALVVRTGCPTERILETYSPVRINIPKAPGLGLLLERPVFDSYNERVVESYQKDKIDFDNYQEEIEVFKQKMIYDQIFREEEKASQ